MDNIAYWIYAVGQAIIVISWLKMQEKHLNVFALAICTFVAPIITGGIIYVALDYLLIWLSSKPAVKLFDDVQS